MYKLENNVEWTDELKNAFKHGITRGKITFDNTEINYDNGLKDIEIQDIKYVPKNGFIGQATARKATINLLNRFQNINLENKEIEIYIGADYNNETYYINYGKFIVNAPPENDSTNGTIKIVAYDYMIKFNKDYVDTMVYPCKLKQLLESICEKAGVELGTQTFANDTFSVTDNQFEGKTLREILQNIAKCAFSWARIGQDNKLYLDFDIAPETTEIITIDEYMQDSYKKANEYYGPINRVTYAETNITGQEESVPEEDSEDIIQNGLKELVIYDNLFAYTTEKRHALIQAGERLLGLTYMPIQELKCVGLIYLDCNDEIQVEDEEENSITSRVFSHIIRYNGAINDTIQTEAYSSNEETYKNKNSPIVQNNRIEILVDRAAKQITSIVEEIGDRSEKTTTITQDIDGIQSAVEDIEDLTNTVSGLKTISITDAYPNENILELHIYGNNSVFDYLYPANDLYPDDNLLPYGDSKIRFYNSQEDRTIDLGIMEVLRQNEEVRDEVAIDYEGNVNLIRRVNANGTTKPMPEVTQLGQLHFTLAEGTNTFEIVNYTAPIEVKYAMKSTLTDIFATRAEMNSEIQQTAESIDVNVNKKLRDYTTHQETEEVVQELNTTIEITAEGINTEVSKKVGTDEVISKINQSAEAVGINANKINLSANDVINLLAGNEINLASKNITIKADDILINNQGLSFTYNNANIGRFVTEEIEGDASKRGVLMDITNSAYFLGLGKQDANGVTQQIFAFYNRPTSNHDNAIQIGNPNWNTFVTMHQDLYVYGYVSGADIINRSLEEIKKDIKKSNINAINEVMNTDIYTYNLKEEKNNSKKHYGIVIGDKYKYSKEIINEDNTGVKLYSMLSILWKAVQEQQEQIKQLQNKIKEMKGEK